ncbi:MAG: cyclic nucleotide-binding domain-containing protein [Anaerolineae bacterium]
MASLEIIEYLRHVPLFANLSERRLERIAEIAHIQSFSRGAHLADAGQPGNAYYYLLAGEAVVRAIHTGGHLRPVAYLHAGDGFGVTSVLLGEPHDTTVVATTDVLALVVRRQELTALRNADPGFDHELHLPTEVSAKLRHKSLRWLQPGEVVVFFSRRHVWVLLRSLLLTILGAALVGFLLLMLLALLGSMSVWIALVGALLVLLPAAVWQYVDWRNDYYIVSTQRVVRREIVLLIYEARYEAPLNRVQDVLIQRHFWGNLLGYGSLIVATAAQSGVGRLVFDYLPNPEAAKSIIFQQMSRAQAQMVSRADESVREELRRRLGLLTPEELERREHVGPDSAPPPTAQLSQKPKGLRRLLPTVRLEQEDSITWRKHPVFLLRRWLAPLVVLCVGIVLFIAYVSGLLPFLSFTPLGALLGGLAFLLPLGFWFWWEYQDWANDVYIVTADRIIDVEKKPLFFAENRREARLDRIQNVNLNVPGPMAAILNYGNVNIDTAGTEGQFTFTRVVAPHEVQREIMLRVARQRERQQQLESAQRRREMAGWFAAYDRLRGQSADKSG